ncbi:hypothetical protein STCU_11228 [Strigomonas culicis]|uniref:Uncharacterized protein n=1 Tax=Strigomonas culicis TaxID=28005 RepID=S9UP59_9TRYP|nr:hypothetical protein STCU_11228 [Strigomonas culicis]|eukprot:EPY16471.1 hypothetical protein STCU_11228 [Strigomonas culicis]
MEILRLYQRRELQSLDGVQDMTVLTEHHLSDTKVPHMNESIYLLLYAPEARLLGRAYGIQMVVLDVARWRGPVLRQNWSFR